jgi:hypothetical protein
MDEPTKEQKFSCGCHIVGGQLVAECTQVAPQGEISAAQHASTKPFARKCARKAALEQRLAAADAKATEDAKVQPIRGTSPDVPLPGPIVGEGHIVEVNNTAIPVSDDNAVSEIGGGVEVHPASE